MTAAELTEIQEALFERIREIRETKGLEYATEQDTLADFKEVAVDAGTDPMKVWLVYVKKHERAIDTFVREGATKSESIDGRILDVIVYHILLMGLVEDKRRHDAAEKRRKELQERGQMIAEEHGGEHVAVEGTNSL